MLRVRNKGVISRGNREIKGIRGEMGMSSLQCLRRKPSAGEIVSQIKSEDEAPLERIMTAKQKQH